MTTKYNVGDKVLIEATVTEIKVNENDIVYELDNDDLDGYLYFSENKIAGKVDEHDKC